jgi:hypothetical protein
MAPHVGLKLSRWLRIGQANNFLVATIIFSWVWHLPSDDSLFCFVDGVT